MRRKTQTWKLWWHKNLRMACIRPTQRDNQTSVQSTSSTSDKMRTFHPFNTNKKSSTTTEAFHFSQTIRNHPFPQTFSTSVYNVNHVGCFGVLISEQPSFQRLRVLQRMLGNYSKYFEFFYFQVPQKNKRICAIFPIIALNTHQSSWWWLHNIDVTPVVIVSRSRSAQMSGQLSVAAPIIYHRHHSYIRPAKRNNKAAPSKPPTHPHEATSESPRTNNHGRLHSESVGQKHNTQRSFWTSLYLIDTSVGK